MTYTGRGVRTSDPVAKLASIMISMLRKTTKLA